MEILILPIINPDIDLNEGIMLMDCDGTGCYMVVNPCGLKDNVFGIAGCY